MICDQVRPFAPAYAAGDLPASTLRWVEEHIVECAACRAATARHAAIVSAIRDVGRREVEPPEDLVASVMERVTTRRRMLPLLPVPPGDVIRLVQDYRETLLGVAAAAAVAAGAAWALAKAVKAVRPAAAAREA